MRKIRSPLDHLLGRAIRIQGGCLVLPGHVGHPNRYETLKAFGRTVKAHRFVFEQVNGPTDEYVLHTCDYPPCFEISHLYAGSQRQNMLDMYERNRRGVVDCRPHRSMAGENNPNYKGGLYSNDPVAWRKQRREKGGRTVVTER